MIETARLFDYPVHLVTPDDALDQMKRAIEEKRNLHIVTLNPEMMMQGDDDEALGQIIRTADLVIPDGAGVVWALRHRGHSNVRRLPGIELSEAALQLAHDQQLRVAMIGARADVITQAADNLQKRFPGLKLVYQHHGYLSDAEDEDRVAQECAAAKPDLMLVALGVPKQEKWIQEHKHRFKGTIFMGIGGSLDIWSGTKQRAPELFLKTNLEWLYRITTEPWRIKRTYRTLPLFVVRVLMSKG